MAARRKPKPERIPLAVAPAFVEEAKQVAEEVRAALGLPNAVSPRIILRCHRQYDQVQDIETTMAELSAGVEVPTYTVRVQVVPA